VLGLLLTSVTYPSRIERCRFGGSLKKFSILMIINAAAVMEAISDPQSELSRSAIIHSQSKQIQPKTKLKAEKTLIFPNS